MGFSNILNEMMKERGISQSKLAKQIGYSQRAVSKWINNQSEPTETPIVLCAKYFGVSTDEMLGYFSNGDDRSGNNLNQGLQEKQYSDELKFLKIYSTLSANGKARILAYSEFVSEEEKIKYKR
ncbi:MAG: helix-turn-helix transcriptional regulator [Clostridia bacterium]|nr:helix-turn-helix transcriptional regulator [Clostridia bacterium]